MARRSFSASFVVAALVTALLPATASGAEPPSLPASVAAVGDSISQAVSSGGSLGSTYPANSWSTGTNTTVNSHYARLLALDPAISGRAYNDSVSGAKVADLDGQMRVVVGQQPDYLTVLIGGNDLCTDTVTQMTSVADFGTRFTAAMDTLNAGSPNTRILVASIPRVNQLWELFKGNFWARSVWSLGDICQSLLASPTSTQAADVQRRAQVAQRNLDFNAKLAEICALYDRCRYDGDAVYNVAFTTSDVSGDYFHPSVAGQAKLAAVTWTAGYWPNGGPAPDVAPTAAFTASCTSLTCTFDASTSTDDHGISAYAWAFGDGGTGAGVMTSHAFPAAGTYTATIAVTDTAGQTGTASKTVTVSTSTAAVHLASVTGSAALKKNGWTATVTVAVRDGAGMLVSGATVTGTWTPGGAASCITRSKGTCSISTSLGRTIPSVTWAVSGVSAQGYAYAPTSNVGSPVTINAP